MCKIHIVLASVLFAVGCGPKAQNMPVVNFSDAWKIGEVKECDTHALLDGVELSGNLVCSIGEYAVLYASNTRRFQSIINNRRTFSVTFKGSGAPSMFVQDTPWIAWRCRKTTDGISCE